MDFQNTIAVKPWALVAFTVISSFIGSALKDRLTAAEVTSTTTTQIVQLQKDVAAQDARLKEHEKYFLTKDEWEIYTKTQDSRLDDMRQDLKDIKIYLQESDIPKRK